jgi:hypothetical protein
MELVLRGLQWNILLIYLDDVIITERTHQEYFINFRKVVQRISDFGLILQPKNVVSFLGHIVSKDGVHTHPPLIQDAEQWPSVCNLEPLRIQVRIGPQESLACRKRQLHGDRLGSGL